MPKLHPLVDQLARVRIRRGIAPTRAAAEAGLSRPTVIRWEHGQYGPGLVEFTAYADYLGYELRLVQKGTQPAGGDR